MAELIADSTQNEVIFPDIATIKTKIVGPSFVQLDTDLKVNDLIYAWGFPTDKPKGDSLTATVEGYSNYGENDDQRLIKLKFGQVSSGASGAALLNRRTGRVCGIIKRTRNEAFDLGGFAIRMEVVLAKSSEVSQAFKEGLANPEWQSCLPPLSACIVPAESLRKVSCIWNVPYLKNVHFTGRETLLADIRQQLLSNEAAALVAIHGLGGVGKTQAASEYAYRHRGDYEIVWWVRADQPTTLAADYACLATEFGLPQAGQPDLKLVTEAVKRELASRKDWLLIFDSAEKPEDVHYYIPPSSGHSIITSRNKHWGGIGREIEIPCLERSESVEFLLARTQQCESGEADQLAAELGDLPLALEQAGAFIAETSCSITSYLQVFAEHRESLLKWSAASGYPETVATTWEISFQRLYTEAAAGATLLNLCAFFGPDRIPLDMIVAGRECLPEPLASALADPVEFGKVKKALRRYSLADIDHDEISVHRLVQSVCQDRLGQSDREMLSTCAIQLVDRAFTFREDDPDTWPQAARLIPHGVVSASQAFASGVALVETSRFLNEAGLFLRNQAEFAAARSFLERSLIIDVTLYGPDHPATANTENSLGTVLKDLGDLVGARQHFERALKIALDAYGSDDAQVGLYMNNLGLLLQEAGDIQGARSYFERGLEIAEAVYSEIHPQLAKSVNNLGTVLRDMGDMLGAIACFKRALKICEEFYGPDAPQVGPYVSNIGLSLRDSGDFQVARSYIERGLRIDQATYGPNHPAVAGDLNNLGLVIQDLGDVAGARAYFEQALKIDEAVFGPDHIRIATYLANLGGALKAQGDLAGAKGCFERAVKIYETTVGPGHPDVARGVKDLGSVLQAQGDYASANTCWERAFVIDKSVYGPNDLNVAVDANNLGTVLKELGDFPRAKKCFFLALAIFHESLGDADRRTIAALLNLRFIDALLKEQS